MDTMSTQDPAIDRLARVAGDILRDGWSDVVGVCLRVVPDAELRIRVFRLLVAAISKVDGTVVADNYHPAARVDDWFNRLSRTRDEVTSVLRVALNG